ncbi:OLC1v1018515C1 [Oldenlandia corymbosa var. corymbosa]|uniref:OLC1v1018515C1 n=1 Tax=Oldenlandia corymbosa var. corymbosa TaxID=529605 RepID=A0AAV1EBS5_OLDCO|nr:OLC1v1018515C1 [Oldenlandia corymbosa var. corymbosa]
MADNTNCTVYVGNLDERVSDRVLYDILIQAGPVVDLYIPRDKETEKPKGYAFAQYETEEIAGYAVKLFSGLVVLYNKTLKFAISGQDKPSANSPALSSSHRQRPHSSSYGEVGVSSNSTKPSMPSRFSEHHLYSSQGFPNFLDGRNLNFSKSVHEMSFSWWI